MGLTIDVPSWVGFGPTRWEEIQDQRHTYFQARLRDALEKTAGEGWEPDEPLAYADLVSQKLLLRIRMRRVRRP